MSNIAILPGDMLLLEERVINEQKLPSIVLMENAGRFVSEVVASELCEGSRVVVFCGTGKNGGDGYVAARHLAMIGSDVMVFSVGDPNQLKGDARIAYQALIGSGIFVLSLLTMDDIKTAKKKINESDIAVEAVVEAIFGTGFNRSLSEEHCAVIDLINSIEAKSYAIDIPAGVVAKTGHIFQNAVKANCTITFQYAKVGHFLFPARDYVGELIVVPLFVDRNQLDIQHIEVMATRDVRAMLPKRKKDAYKGEFGKALLIAGSVGLSGAATMSARAALRTGVGLLSVCTPEIVAPSLWCTVPEAMVFPMPDNQGMIDLSGFEEILSLYSEKNCAAIGPGLGNNEDLLGLINEMLDIPKPIILDADALNILSKDVSILRNRKADIVITPHYGEMARLTKASIAEIKGNPMKYAAAFAQENGIVVLLKGATSIIASFDNQMSFNITGGPQLSKGGSGDVLSGIILALLAQGKSTYDAARYGSLVLGMAAENVKRNENSVLPSDVVEAISNILDY